MSSFFIHWPSLISLLVSCLFSSFLFFFLSFLAGVSLVVTSVCDFLISLHPFLLLFFLSAHSFPSAPSLRFPFSSGSGTHRRGRGNPVNLCLNEPILSSAKRGYQRVQLLSETLLFFFVCLLGVFWGFAFFVASCFISQRGW